MGFRNRLKELRENRKLSQAELAKAVGVSVGLIGMYESGKRNPSKEKLEAIADYFNVSLDYLNGKEDGSAYYLDPETARLADEMKDNPGRRVLMSAAEDLTPEEILEVIDFVNNLKKGNPDP